MKQPKYSASLYWEIINGRRPNYYNLFIALIRVLYFSIYEQVQISNCLLGLCDEYFISKPCSWITSWWWELNIVNWDSLFYFIWREHLFNIIIISILLLFVGHTLFNLVLLVLLCLFYVISYSNPPKYTIYTPLLAVYWSDIIFSLGLNVKGLIPFIYWVSYHSPHILLYPLAKQLSDIKPETRAILLIPNIQ